MFRSGSPRPLSKPRNTFTLFTTPLSRAARPLSSIRHLARCPSFTIDMSELYNQWETYTNEKPSHDIRNTCTRLKNSYQQANERRKSKHLNDLFPLKEGNDPDKTLNDYLPAYEERKINDDELNVQGRFPKLLNDSADYYAQFNHSNTSIMKKRPYESSENSNEG
jgi:hypothetical protein